MRVMRLSRLACPDPIGAEPESRERADGDQNVHVRTRQTQAVEGAPQEAPAADELDRRRQSQLHEWRQQGSMPVAEPARHHIGQKGQEQHKGENEKNEQPAFVRPPVGLQAFT